jgi:hypothetical protein
MTTPESYPAFSLLAGLVSPPGASGEAAVSWLLMRTFAFLPSSSLDLVMPGLDG